MVVGLGLKTVSKLTRVGSPLRSLLGAVSVASRFALTLLAPIALAAAPEKLLRVAGPLPSDASMRAAVLKHLQRNDRALDRRKPFKILSGPTLATGNTFGGSIEQAWLMCVVVNAEKTAPSPRGIEGKALYLQRNPGGELMVVPVDNWQHSSPQC